MPVAADFHSSAGLAKRPTVRGLSALGGLMLAWRNVGMVAVLGGMLAACSTPPERGEAAAYGAETPTGRYVHQVMEQLMKKWDYYRSQKPYDVAYGHLPVEFTLNVEGKAENIHVRNTPKTNPDLTRFTVKSIQEAKLPPMPADVVSALKAQDEECLKFGYIMHSRPPQEEAKRMMEQRWGMLPRARVWRVSRGRGDAMTVKLTSSESGVRQAAGQAGAQQPSTAPTKGGSAGDGQKTAVKQPPTPKERYIQRVTQAVEKKWLQYCKMQLAGITYGSLKVVFYVNKNGKVEDARVVDDKYSYRDLTLFTLRAIKDADIPGMPADVTPSLPMNDQQRLKIEYNVLIY